MEIILGMEAEIIREEKEIEMIKKERGIGEEVLEEEIRDLEITIDLDGDS